MGRALPLDLGAANGRSRRISLVALRPGEGRLTEPTAAIQPWRQELVFMPLKRPSRSARELAQFGGP